MNSVINYNSYKGSAVTLINKKNEIVGFFRGVDFFKNKDGMDGIGTIFIPYKDSSSNTEIDSKAIYTANTLVIDQLNDFGTRYSAIVPIDRWRESTAPLFEFRCQPLVLQAGGSDYYKIATKYLENL